MHLVSESLHLVDESLHLVSESLHLVDESLHLVDESLHLVSESLHLVSESLHLASESLHLVDESLHLVDEFLVLASESLILVSKSLHLVDEFLTLVSQLKWTGKSFSTTFAVGSKELESFVLHQEESLMQLVRCLHVAVLVANLEQAEHFYGTILGLPKVDRALKFPGAWYEIDGFQIHLITNPSPATELQDAEKWGRNRHLAFSVASLDAAKAQLLAHHCPIQMSASGRAALFTQDPDGNVIELQRFPLG